MSVASLAGYLQGGGGGGGVNEIVAGDGIYIVDDGAGAFTITNGGVLGIDAGAGINVVDNDGVYTITNTGVGQAITFVEGGGISIVQEPENTYTFTNTGGGGGGNVNGLVAGAGIGLEDDGQGVFTISNGGVLNVIDGDGIGVVGDNGVFTITNTGVLKISAGEGITLSGTNDDITITNSGGAGGGITAVNSGAGITADTAGGVVSLTNTGVLTLTAGVGITLNGGNDNITITNSGGGITAVNGSAGITADDVDGVVSLTNTGVLALTAGSGISITGTNANRTINATGTNTFTDVIITDAGHTATLGVNTSSNLTVNTEIVATEPWVASAYFPINGIIAGQLSFNIGALTAGAFTSTLYTVPNYNGSATTICLISEATVYQDGLVITCGIEWAGNAGADANFRVSLANYSGTNAPNSPRGFNILIIR